MLLNIFTIILLSIIILLGLWLFAVLQKNRSLQSSFGKLLLSFNELDEQAKLIVRTDLELNKAQEDLDKRLRALDALQKTSRLVSTTLDETEIFQRLNQPLLTELGFQKYLILIFSEDKTLHCCVNFGFLPEETQGITSFLETNQEIQDLLSHKNLLSSNSASADIRESLMTILNLKYFVIAPILAQTDMPGIIIAGNQADAFTISEGDEELISILADQIGQAVRNARLFEKVYRSSQMLELKVKERTKELSSALEQVQRISKAKSEFISAVSHELRTPLTSIKGYAALLITGKIGEIPQQVKERLEKINAHSDNLVKMINDLLDIARIESGRTEMKFSQHDLSSLIANVQDLLTPQLKEKDIRFIVTLPPSPRFVFADANQLERVLINLISNAIKFTPEQGTITITVDGDDKKISITIADTGIGIKEEDQAKLFTEFYRADNAINQNVKGSGLGLVLTKKIVEAHNGKISVTSKSQQGTTFLLVLPVEQPKNPAR
jgi:signal transduction histidine kinase